MEAINLYKPIIITGAFTGQEEKNPEFVTKNDLGVECKDINLLPQIIKDLFDNDGEKLRTIYTGQARFRSPDASKNIAEEVIELLENQEPSINMLTAIDSNRQVSI
jgi:processive 1,2-diacylglycerol beta-glucosyltransferase